MNINITTSNPAPASSNNSSSDAIRALEQTKNQLTQQLNEVKSSKKTDKASQDAAEKTIKSLNDQIKNIEEQISTLKKQKQSATSETQNINTTQKANNSDNNNCAIKLTENRRFDRYEKTDELDLNEFDNTYRIAEQDGNRVVEFNNKNKENNNQLI